MILNFEIIGAWLVVLMTLSIFSYLYGDNFFYKSAEHIFVGVSAGYIFAITFWDQIYPNLLGRLFPSFIDAGYDFVSYIIPFILGIFMILIGSESQLVIEYLLHCGYGCWIKILCLYKFKYSFSNKELSY